MKRFLVVLVSLLLVHNALAEEPTKPIAEKPLFKKMLGNWQGHGWIYMGPNNRVEFSQTERVKAKANNHVVTIEGQAVDKQSKKVAFGAFAILNYNKVTQKYEFNAYRSDGNSIKVEPTLTDDGFVWGFDTGRGLIRYTAKITQNSWSQIGEFSYDNGKTWNQTFEMKLTKIGSE